MLALCPLPAPTWCTPPPAVPRVGFGAPGLDRRLQGGLERAALHEFYGENPDDAAAVTSVALLLGSRAAGVDGAVLLLREDRDVQRFGRLHAPGLCELGIAPQSFLLVTAHDTVAVLRAAADAIKSGSVGAVIVAPAARAAAYDLTASRRLALAAARADVMTLVLRIAAAPVQSAAQTRWRVGAAPSAVLAGNAPGRPAFEIELLRHRGGVAAFGAQVEWDRDRRSFADAALSGAAPAVAGGRAAAA